MKRSFELVLFVLLLLLVSCDNNTEIYFIDFVTNCDIEINEMKVKDRNTAIELPDLKRVGYEFEGWYLDSEYTEKMPSNVKISNDYTLYAKWSKDYCKKFAYYGSTFLYIDENGDLYMWGGFSFSELFFGETKLTFEPTHLLEGMKFKHIAVNDIGYLLLIDIDNNLYHYGDLKNGTNNYRMAEKLDLISNDIKFKYASVSNCYVLAVSIDDNLYGWGENWNYCIGGSKVFYEKPFQITSESNILTCANTNQSNSAYITKDGSLFTWGSFSSCLGHPEIDITICIGKPLKVLNLENLVDITMKGATYLIDKDGIIHYFGQIPSGVVTTPKKIDSFDNPIGKMYQGIGGTYFITENGKLYFLGDNSRGLLDNFNLNLNKEKYYDPYEISLGLNVKNFIISSSMICVVDFNNNLYTAGYIDDIGIGESVLILEPTKLVADNISFNQAVFYSSDENLGNDYAVYGISDNNVLYRYYNGNFTKELENIIFIDSEINLQSSCLFAIDGDNQLYIKGKLPIKDSSEFLLYDKFTKIYSDIKFKSVNKWYAITVEGNLFDILSGDIILEGKNIKVFSRIPNGFLVVDGNGVLWGKGTNQYGELFNGTTGKVNEFTKIDFQEKIKKIDCTNYYVEILTEEGNLYHCGKFTDGIITLMDTGVIDTYQGNLYIKEDGLYSISGEYYKASPDHYIGQGKSKVYFDYKVKSIYADNDRCVVVTENGEIYIWGRHFYKTFLDINYDFYQRDIKLLIKGGK